MGSLTVDTHQRTQGTAGSQQTQTCLRRSCILIRLFPIPRRRLTPGFSSQITPRDCWLLILPCWPMLVLHSLWPVAYSSHSTISPMSRLPPATTLDINTTEDSERTRNQDPLAPPS